MGSLFPDAEQVAQDICQRHSEAFKFLPDELDEILSRTPVSLVERVGGESDGVTDRALVQIAVWANTRAEAWDVAGIIADDVDSLRFGGEVSGVFVDTTERATGMVQVPTADPDERRVTATFRLDFRRQ